MGPGDEAMYIHYNLSLILGMRRLNDHILVVSADWENPAPEIPVFEWKCEFTEEGGEVEGER